MQYSDILDLRSKVATSGSKEPSKSSPTMRPSLAVVPIESIPATIAYSTTSDPYLSIADLIDDDPSFHLSSKMLANFAHPGEIYLESDRAMQSIDIQNGMMNELESLKIRDRARMIC